MWSTARAARALSNVRLRGAARSYATLAEDVKSDNTFRIPVVEFRKFRDPMNEAQRKETANEVVNAFREVGFVYLSHHGIAEPTVRNVIQKSEQFFNLPSEVKDNLAWDDPRSNRGYVAQGRERVTQATDAEEIARLRAQAPDAKETMEIGRDWNTTWNNKWPHESDAPGFKATMLNFYKVNVSKFQPKHVLISSTNIIRSKRQECHELHEYVMSSVALGLGLKPTFFAKLIDQQFHNLRLLHYPPIKADILRREGQARAGAHSDYGSLTFVFQDEVGGLEVQNPHSGKFHPATPIPNTVVVNVGDLLARWSNDVLRSTLHRVVAPTTTLSAHMEYTPSRRSIAFFCNPNQDAEISALPTCVSDERPAKYPTVNTEKYIVQRLTDTYDY